MSSMNEWTRGPSLALWGRRGSGAHHKDMSIKLPQRALLVVSNYC